MAEQRETVADISRCRSRLTDEEIERLLVQSEESTSEDVTEHVDLEDTSDDVTEYEDEEEDVDAVLALLQPIAIDLDYASGSDLVRKGDIDTILISCRTIEPFACKYACRISTKPKIPTLVKNVKFTKYMNKRSCFDLRYEPAFECRNENNEGTWMEFTLGEIDGRDIFVIFRMDASSPFFDGVPQRSTTESEGCTRAACSSFMTNIIIRAAQELPMNTETSKAGIKYVSFDVARNYNVMRADFQSFAKCISHVLLTTDMREVCGMNCVRFYTCQHGMRLEKYWANLFLRDIVDVDHAHVDVLQIHRADNLSFDDEDPIVVKLSGRENDSLLSLFAGSINLGGKIERYRTGFLADYGYFARNASPPVDDHVVTFAQAYSSAAKMARPVDSGFVAAYVISRGFRIADRQEERKGNETRQYVKDIVSYCYNYVRCRQSLRVEEVLTLDVLRLHDSLSEAVERLRVFDDEPCLMTMDLIRRGIVYRLNNWKLYFDSAIGTDIRFLYGLVTNIDSLDEFSWMPPPAVRQAIRAEFRIMYFAHGSSYEYNYAVMRHIFTQRTELGSNRNGVIQLRSLYDDTDNFVYPLYTSRISAHHMVAIRHAWWVQNGIWDSYVEEQGDERDLDSLKFLVTAYAAWGYGKAFLTSDARSEVDVIALTERLYPRYTDVFSLDFFLREYRKYSPRQTKIYVSGTVQADYISQAMIRDPSTSLAKTILACVRITDRIHFFNLLTIFIKEHFQVFPLTAIKYKSGPCVWCVVKRGEAIITARGVTLTVAYVRQMMRTMRRRRRERRRGRIPFKPKTIVRQSRVSTATSAIKSSKTTSRVVVAACPTEHAAKATLSATTSGIASMVTARASSKSTALAGQNIRSPVSTTIYCREESPSTIWRVQITRAIVHATQDGIPAILTGTSTSGIVSTATARLSLTPSLSSVSMPRRLSSVKRKRCILSSDSDISIHTEPIKDPKVIKTRPSLTALKRGKSKRTNDGGTRRSRRLKNKDRRNIAIQSGARTSSRNKNVSNVKVMRMTSFTWTAHHDSAIVWYVLKIGGTRNTFRLSNLIRLRPELFGDVKTIQIKNRILQIAAGLVSAKFATKNKEKLRQFRELVRAQQ